MQSLAEYLASHSEEQESFFSSMSEAEKEELKYSYSFWARKSQLEPKDYFTWLILSGRGFGKTWVGSHWVIQKALNYRGCHIGLIGDSAADIRDVMVEQGSSSIIRLSSPNFFPKYEPSKRRITWSNGSFASLYSADKPAQLRGPQHHFIWADELAKYRNAYEVYDMAMFGLRLGNSPQALITTTPKPSQLLKDIIADKGTIVTTGSTFENASNLSGVFLEEIKKRYEGTSLGQQELYGNLLDEAEGALWTRQSISENRAKEPESFDEIVIGVDVAVTSTENSDETGIIIVGRIDDKGYVLEDLSGVMKPSEMANIVLSKYWQLGCSRIILETNQGGDFLTETLRLVEEKKGLAPASIKKVWASKAKKIRAGIVQPLYEQNRIKHCSVFAKLEDQMCTWIPGDNESPDRLDALVWALTDLFVKPTRTQQFENTLW